MQKLTINTVVKRKDEKLITSELDNELVMMDLENGNYLNLNKTARIIWELIDKPIMIKDIVSNLTSRFNINEEKCQNETITFLNKLSDQKALEVAAK